MAKRTVKATIERRNPDKFLTLCNDIITQHEELGTSSPFADANLIDMPKFKDRLLKAQAARKKALEHYAIAEAAMRESRVLMGVTAGQTVITPGTLYNMATTIKKILQALNDQNPESLSPWGFNVVVRMAKNRGKAKKPVTG